MEQKLTIALSVQSKDGSQDMERAVLTNLVKYHVLPELEALGKFLETLTTVSASVKVEVEQE